VSCTAAGVLLAGCGRHVAGVPVENQRPIVSLSGGPAPLSDVLYTVRLRWTGLDGKELEAEFGDRAAVCVQHEADHLEGRLFIDHLSPVKRTMITSRMKKLKREKARA
jgi:hypothetical protein